MKTLLIVPAFMLAAVPLLSFAATYHYVNVEGETATVEAPNATVAIETAPARHPNSGVAIDQGEIEPGTDVTAGVVAGASTDVSIFGTGGADMYAYVNQSGMTALVSAPDPMTAIEVAPNIDENSGVAIYVGEIEPGTPVPNVD